MSATTTASFAAAAALVALASITASTPAFARHHGMSKVAEVECYGVNTCKGTADCKTAHNDCKGQNSCKGMGFKHLSAKACTAAHGSLTPPAA